MSNGFKNAVADLDDKIAKLRADKATLIAQKQANCPHKDYWEGLSTPPFRVCLECGYAEEGWHAGYWKLGRGVYDAPRVSPEKARKLILGSMVRQHEMILLGRYGEKRAEEERARLKRERYA